MPAKVVQKYQLLAAFRERDALEWTLAVETGDGAEHRLPVVDGDDLPILLSLFDRGQTVYFDTEARVLSTDWNSPGRH